MGMMKIGMQMYQEPALRMTQNCTGCDRPLTDKEGSSTEAGMIASKCGNLGEKNVIEYVETLEQKKCKVCNRFYTIEKE